MTDYDALVERLAAHAAQGRLLKQRALPDLFEEAADAIHDLRRETYAKNEIILGLKEAANQLRPERDAARADAERFAWKRLECDCENGGPCSRIAVCKAQAVTDATVEDLRADRDALREYAQHKAGCFTLSLKAFTYEPKGGCTCGFDAALAAAQE